jgi:hypothetical protein
LKWRSSTAVEHSGPEVEVVVTQDTIFYEDITKVNFAASEGESKEQTVQQEVRQVDPPSDLAQGASVLVWGERHGDRVVATVVVFTGGPVMSKRTILIGGLVLVVLGLLAGGVYTAVQRLAPEAENGG